MSTLNIKRQAKKLDAQIYAKMINEVGIMEWGYLFH